MPITFLAHQAPMLPLKRLCPQWFCGTALILGSMAPDVEYFLRGEPFRGLGHSLAGQFLFCLPVTLVLVWLVTQVVARPLALHLPDAGAFHLRGYALLAVSSRRPGYWLAAIPSALIGFFSHVVWDGITHDHGWGARWLGYDAIAFHVAGKNLGLPQVLQYASSLIGVVVTLWLLHRVGSERSMLPEGFRGGRPPPRSPAPPARPNRAVSPIINTGSAARPAPRRGNPSPPTERARGTWPQKQWTRSCRSASGAASSFPAARSTAGCRVPSTTARSASS